MIKLSNFEELLNKDNSVSIHQNNIYTLVIELYNIANDMSPEIMCEVFKERDTLNSVRNKYSSLQQTVLSKTDILLLSETKIDYSFPDSQFFAVGFKMYREDRTKTGGGLLLYINEILLGKINSSYKFKKNSEIILFEFSVSNKKWLLLGDYKPPSQNDLSFINELNLALNFFRPIYENLVLLGDFNMSTENPNLKNFMCSFDLDSVINWPTCYKSINPTCIDLILTNKKSFYEVRHI